MAKKAKGKISKAKGKISKAKQKYIDEYKKQRKRIKSIEYRLNKKGLEVNKFVLPTVKEIKEYTTAEIKRAVSGLKKVTSKTYNTQPIKREELLIPPEKPAEDGFTLNYILDALHTATEEYNKESAEYVRDFIDDTIAEDGIEEVNNRIKSASQEAYRLAFEMTGDSDPQDVFNSLYALCYIINGGKLPDFFALDLEIKKNQMVRERNHYKYVKYKKKKR